MKFNENESNHYMVKVKFEITLVEEGKVKPLSEFNDLLQKLNLEPISED